MSIIIKAKCLKCNYKNGDYRIFNWTPIQKNNKISEIMLSKYFTFSSKGNDTYIDEGKEYEIEIEEVSRDPKYGSCVKIISVPSLTKLDFNNMSREENYEILMDCTSSPRIANNILDAYPNFIYTVLTEGKEAIDLSKINGVGEAYLNAYTRNLNEKYKYYAIVQHFKDYQLDITDCKLLCERYINEEGIENAFKENPYKVLYECLGRSFAIADKVIMYVRPELKESELRCAYLILSVLEKNEQEGSTRLNGADLYAYIENELNVPELIPFVYNTATTNDLFYYDEATQDLSTATTYNGECLVADYVKSKIENSTELDIDWKPYTIVDDFTMSEKQSKALELFCKYNFFILGGYSGSGKTTSVKSIVKLCEDNSLSYTLLAPTGKASMRITESVHRPSSTIHRKCLRDKEINSDVLIVDETSMVDLPTFVMLINCIVNPNIRVVLVGDNAQLMPVGIGCIFNDLINSGKVPMIILDEIFRYDTDGGLFVATNVRQGKRFFDNTDMVKQDGNVYSICDNYKFIQTEEIFDTLVSEYMKLIKKGVKPSEILCLSPYNVGDEGTYKINNAIQLEINPTKPNEVTLGRKINNYTNVTFRVGDRLLNKKNDYQALPFESWKEIESSYGVLTEEDVILTSIFNGQDGIIREVTDKHVVVQFNEELIVINKSKLNNVLLAYCISVHSSQGSEAKYVINVVSPTHKRMLNRNLLYVALTRAKVQTIDIGDLSTFEDALLIDGNSERYTWLKELLGYEKE